MSEVEGGCLCGRVRYRAKIDAAQMAVCHCRNCQKQAGSAFSVLFVVQADAITISGETKVFEDQGDSGNKVMRHFCPNCGSPIVSRLSANPGIVAVKAGTLDDPSWLDPKVHVWCASAQPWVQIKSDAIQFQHNPG